MEQTKETTAKDVASRLARTDLTIDTLIEMAANMCHYSDGFDKYWWADFTKWPGKGHEDELEDYLSCPWDPYGARGIEVSEIDWDGTHGDDPERYGFNPDDSIPADDAIFMFNNLFGCFGVESLKKVQDKAWENRAAIIEDYGKSFGSGAWLEYAPGLGMTV